MTGVSWTKEGTAFNTLLQTIKAWRTGSEPKAVDAAWSGWLLPTTPAEHGLAQRLGTETRSPAALEDELRAAVLQHASSRSEAEVVLRFFGVHQQPESRRDLVDNLPDGYRHLGAGPMDPKVLHQRIVAECNSLAIAIDSRAGPEGLSLPWAPRSTDEDPVLASALSSRPSIFDVAASDARGRDRRGVLDSLDTIRARREGRGPIPGESREIIKLRSKRARRGLPVLALHAHRVALKAANAEAREEGLLGFLPRPTEAGGLFDELAVHNWDDELFTAALDDAIAGRDGPNAGRRAAALVSYVDRCAPNEQVRWQARAVAVAVGRRAADRRAIPLALAVVRGLDKTDPLHGWAARNAALLVSHHDDHEGAQTLLSMSLTADGQPGLHVKVGIAMRRARYETDNWRKEGFRSRITAATDWLNLAIHDLTRLADTFELEKTDVAADRALALERRLIEVQHVIRSTERVAPKNMRQALTSLGTEVDHLLAKTLAGDARQRSREAEPYQQLLRALLYTDLEIAAGNRAAAIDWHSEASTLLRAAAAYPHLVMRFSGQAVTLGVDSGRPLLRLDGLVAGYPIWPVPIVRQARDGLHHLWMYQPVRQRAGRRELP